VNIPLDLKSSSDTFDAASSEAGAISDFSSPIQHEQAGALSMLETSMKNVPESTDFERYIGRHIG
jgi:hypothetical protein